MESSQSHAVADHMIESIHHATGQNKMWWRQNECGYTENIAEAGRYTEVEAARICERSPGRNKMWPIRVVLSGLAGSVMTVVSRYDGNYL